MAIAFSTLTFTGFHGVPVEGEIDAPLQVYRVPGVQGEAHLVDRVKSIPVSIDVTIVNQANLGALQTTLDNINAKVGTADADTSVVISGAVSQTISNCTLLGIFPAGPPKFDGSGTYGWTRKAQLRFIRRLS